MTESSSAQSPDSPRDTSPQTLYSCDACSNAFFHTRDQLEEHIVSRHSHDLFQDYAALLSAGRAAHKQWPSLKKMPVVSQKLEQWGERAFHLAVQRDGGEEKMKEAHAARAQLEVAVKRWLPSCSVYIFGSSVALGVWDGTSDIDFSVVDVAALENRSWAPNEKGAVRSIAQVLFRAGFAPHNLELIPFARVPIVKHHANTPLLPPSLLEATGRRFDAAERVVARSARFHLAAPATPHDRVLLEASIRSSISSPDAVEAIWWDRKAVIVSVTFTNTTECVRALTSPLVTSPANRVSKVEPLHVEHRPEIFQIDFDMSFRVFGIRNSLLLRKYLMAHPCARPGSLVLKDWSKTSGVNNSHGGFFTSYAVNIMWIYYLVRTGYVPYIDPLDIPSSLADAEHSPDPQYVPMKPADALTDEQRAAQMALMGELLVSFFRFYAFEFDWEKHVVSLNRHEVTTKEELGWAKEDVSPGRRHTRYMLCIEDPYEESLNLGRHIGPTKAKRVMQEFIRGYLSLVKDDVEESCVFELSDNANTEELLPPAAALLDLVKACMIIFEEHSVATVGDGSQAPPASLSGEEKQQKAGCTIIKSDVLKDALQKRCPASLTLALRCWSFPQLVFRLGYKCIGNSVYRRGTFAAVPTVAPASRFGSAAAGGATHDAAVKDPSPAVSRVQAFLAEQVQKHEEALQSSSSLSFFHQHRDNALLSSLDASPLHQCTPSSKGVPVVPMSLVRRQLPKWSMPLSDRSGASVAAALTPEAVARRVLRRR